MKLASMQEAGDVQVAATVGTQRTFQIHNNIKSFRILSDGLYSDKVTAVIRELSCNAWDSHVAAGKVSVPFEIHFPNGLEPWFSVRDFGIGLCEEDVYNLYTTYFSSSKDQSNDFIGALGLGSKSPFSYCETFTVTVNFNGMKQIFSAFISEEGLPTIIKMHEEATTEGNGLEVKFPVKRDDINAFHYKGANVLEFFKVRPKSNINGYTIPKQSYLLEGKVDGCWWGIKQNNAVARAIMGSIAYPLDLGQHGLSASEQVVAQCGVDIEFKLGDLEIAASREKLSFNKTTVAVVKARYEAIFEQMSKVITEKLDGAKTIWEARKVLNTMLSDQSTGRIARIMVSNDKIKGKYTNFEFDGQTGCSFKPSVYTALNLIQVTPANGQWPKKSLLTSDYKTTIQATEKQRFILNDMHRGHNQILAAMVADGSQFLLITPKKEKDETKADDHAEAVETQITDFMACFNGAVLEKISDNQDLLTPKVKGEKKVRIRKNYFLYSSDTTWSGSFEHIPDAEFDTEAEAEDTLFFPIFKMKPAQKELQKDSADSFGEFIQNLRNAGILTKTQKLIAYKVREEFEVTEVEKDLWSFVNTKIAEMLKDPKIASFYHDDNNITVPTLFSNRDILDQRKNKKGEVFFATDYGKLMLEYLEYTSAKSNSYAFVQMCYTLGIKKVPTTYLKDLGKRTKAAKEKYPMLEFVQGYYLSNNFTELVNYLNLVDGK